VDVAGVDNERSGLGYALAILLSAIGHAGLALLVLVVLPNLIKNQQKEPPVYTVKIFDSLPAGDLGTHLPRLSHHTHRAAEAKANPAEEKPPVVEHPKTELPIFSNDKNALALNTITSPVLATPTPTPTPPPTPAPEITPVPTPEPTPVPIASTPPTPEPVRTAPPAPPEKTHNKPKVDPSIAIAMGEKAPSVKAPSVKQQLEKIRQELLAGHLAEEKKAPKPEPAHEAKKTDSDDDDEEGGEEAKPSGGGPIAAHTATEGKGAGVGPGTGSAGIQQNLDFLLYYRAVQERIKKAWSFSGGNNDLTTTVNFSIDQDGKLQGVKIAASSHDGSFDDSVVRAIRRAAPFPPPPEKYRAQFSEGIEAVFKLGELNS
jgi:TonB family protein